MGRHEDRQTYRQIDRPPPPPSLLLPLMLLPPPPLLLIEQKNRISCFFLKRWSAKQTILHSGLNSFLIRVGYEEMWARALA